MLQVIDVTKYYGAEPILEGISFVLNPADRVGLIGANGCGKSTLLRIIAGLERPDAGRVSLDRAATIGFLPQGIASDQGLSVAAEVRAGIVGLEDARHNLEQLGRRLAEAQDGGGEATLSAYGEALTRFEALGGYTVEHRIDEVLSGLGLADVDPHTPLSRLSGGQQTRVGLARLLISPPSLLLLDEPTNHLDVQALEWLESFLISYQGAALIVSHDRTFLDNTVQRILALDEDTHRLTEHSGNYTTYELAKDKALAKQWVTWKDDQAELRRLKRDIQRASQQALHTERATTDSSARRLAAKVAKKAKARQRKLERYISADERVDKPKTGWELKLDFADMPRAGTIVARFEGLGHRFDNHWLFRRLDHTIHHGERIALLGANGSGKSTLFRILVGELSPKQGRVQLGTSVRLGYMPQKYETLDPQQTPLSLVRSMASISETEARNFLHYFLFAGDDVFIPLADLSYGERARLLLARLVVAGSNFLVLDEPINHLDIPSRQRFQAALQAFPGAVLLAAHDRAFIQDFATHTWHLRGGELSIRYHRA